MSAKLNDCIEHLASRNRLAELYACDLVPADKKPFVVDLEKSTGAYLAIKDDDDVVLLDAASQIATLGLGFNHSALFGAAQHLSSWIDDTRSGESQNVQSAYVDLLRRKLGSPSHHISFCHSGAEAIEQALAICFERRPNKSARRVLAFAGAFHGRTKMALETTWSPEKREPFSWTEQAAFFAPYPEMDCSDPAQILAPTHWIELWSERTEAIFLSRLAELESNKDTLLARELESLQTVRKSLAENQVFAILIEPMQCEGGERYSSRRFHQGLAALAQSFAVPLIYDEIQTGFHLGRSFFWHRQFALTSSGKSWVPDIIVTAKKAQVGIVLSRWPVGSIHAVAPVSIARGYIQASVLDQFSDAIAQIESAVAARLNELASRYTHVIRRPRGQGLAFAFDFVDAELLKRAIAARFRFGLVFYPAGEQAARFRLNLSFDSDAIAQLFKQLGHLLASFDAEFQLHPPTERQVELPSVEHHYEFHRKLISEKLSRLRGESVIEPVGIQRFLEEQLHQIGLPRPEIAVHLLDRTEYQHFREKILQIQLEVYEPARQTPGEDFDLVFASDRPLGVVIEKAGQIIGMAFAGPLKSFSAVHGVGTDPLRDDPDAAYMVDVTVTSSFRGRLGRTLKQAVALLAIAKGYRTLCGRNRDHLARGMWAINLSLGSYVTQYLENDYNDEEVYRDCLYYHCNVVWKQPALNLSNGIESPFGLDDLTEQFVARNLSLAVNKLTLSNFVDEPFIADLQTVVNLFPPELRHACLASSLSEGFDKVVKSLWLSRAPRKRLLVFRGHFFGDTTLLTRSLSEVGEPLFEVQFVNEPQNVTDDPALAALRSALQSDQVLALFVEPISSQRMHAMDRTTLAQVRDVCSEFGVPLVYNETASMFFRYGNDSFSVSGIADVVPDVTVAHLGGQQAIVLLRRSLFVAEPLKLISTWEGDGFALAKFAAAAHGVFADTNAFFQLTQEFERVLSERILRDGTAQCRLRSGAGWIEGNFKKDLELSLDQVSKSVWRVCPTASAMREFLRRFKSG